MCEIAPGVYTAPRMTAAVREHVWRVLEGWFFAGVPDSVVVMTWPDLRRVGGQAIKILGSPKTELHEHDGSFLVRSELTQASIRALRCLKSTEL